MYLIIHFEKTSLTGVLNYLKMFYDIPEVLWKQITPFVHNQLNCPVEWLEVIGKYQINICTWPKFGHHLEMNVGIASYGQTLLAWEGNMKMNIEMKKIYKYTYIMHKMD